MSLAISHSHLSVSCSLSILWMKQEDAALELRHFTLQFGRLGAMGNHNLYWLLLFYHRLQQSFIKRNYITEFDSGSFVIIN